MEVETDLQAVLSKAFLQVDAALAAELQIYGNGKKNYHLHLCIWQTLATCIAFQGTHILSVETD